MSKEYFIAKRRYKFLYTFGGDFINIIQIKE